MKLIANFLDFFALINPSALLSICSCVLTNKIFKCAIEFIGDSQKVTLLVAFTFLPRNFGKVVGTYK